MARVGLHTWQKPDEGEEWPLQTHKEGDVTWHDALWLYNESSLALLHSVGFGSTTYWSNRYFPNSAPPGRISCPVRDLLAAQRGAWSAGLA